MGLVTDPPPRARSTYALVASGDNPLMSSAVTVDAVEPLDEGGGSCVAIDYRLLIWSYAFTQPLAIPHASQR